MSVDGSAERAEAVLALLRAARDFGDAHDQMMLRLKGDMEVNASDLAALRALIIAEDAGTVITPADLARHLDISTASTTKLVDRLEESGHLLREPHPTDRRSRALALTQLSRDDFWRLFGARLRAMSASVADIDSADLDAAVRVMAALGEAMSARLGDGDEPEMSASS